MICSNFLPLVLPQNYIFVAVSVYGEVVVIFGEVRKWSV
jgi:hypothetical protein